MEPCTPCTCSRLGLVELRPWCTFLPGGIAETVSSSIVVLRPFNAAALTIKISVVFCINKAPTPATPAAVSSLGSSTDLFWSYSHRYSLAYISNTAVGMQRFPFGTFAVLSRDCRVLFLLVIIIFPFSPFLSLVIPLEISRLDQLSHNSAIREHERSLWIKYYTDLRNGKNPYTL